MAFVTVTVLFFMILNFARFHFQLVLRNNTTLEKMDSERTKNPVITEAS